MPEDIDTLFERYFDPPQKDVELLFKEMMDASADEDDIYANGCADKIFNLVFQSSIRYARFISDIEEKLEEKDLLNDKESDFAQRLVKRARTRYSEISDSLRTFYEFQRECKMTNAPE